jgi:radical SAM/Cys-rich protein
MNLKFLKELNWQLIKKTKIEVLQINLWKKCNLACLHCHVEAWPTRTEELEETVLKDILEIIKNFPQIKIIDLTGWAPEMNNGFRDIVNLSVSLWKKVIVRSNLTILFEKWFEDLPEYLSSKKVEIVASLPCYLKDNVDKMRGEWTFDKSVKALQILNKLGYWKELTINLVYNTAMTSKKEDFTIAPDQNNLEKDYKKFLWENFWIVFNSLFVFTNIASWRLKKYLKAENIYNDYIDFLSFSYNPNTLENLMCKNQLSIDYMWNIYDCDFNQVEWVNSIWNNGEKITLKTIIKENNLDLIKNVITKDYCFGCTAWAGCSCSGALV